MLPKEDHAWSGSRQAWHCSGPPALFIIAAIAAIAIRHATSSGNTSDWAGEWARVAEEYRLDFTDSGASFQGSLEGTVDGHHVLVELWQAPGKNRQTFTQVTVSLRQPMPNGMRITSQGALGAIGQLVGGQDIEVGDPGVDVRLQIRGQHSEDVVSLLANPELVDATRALTGSHDELSTIRARISKRGRVGAEVGPMIIKALRLAKAASNARIAPWRDLEQEPNLTLTFEDETAHLNGTFDGARISVVGDRKSGEVVIHVPLNDGLPPALHIQKGTGELGDFILDRTIQATGASPEVLLRLLSNEDLKEYLLTVVHGFEGSTVDAQHVTLKTRAFSDPELRERLSEAVRLARSLNERQAAIDSNDGLVSDTAEAQGSDAVRPPPQKQSH